MDYYDAYANATFKRPKPYPRPWSAQETTYGKGTAIPLDELADVLAAHREAVESEKSGTGSDDSFRGPSLDVSRPR